MNSSSILSSRDARHNNSIALSAISCDRDQAGLIIRLMTTSRQPSSIAPRGGHIVQVAEAEAATWLERSRLGPRHRDTRRANRARGAAARGRRPLAKRSGRLSQGCKSGNQHQSCDVHVPDRAKSVHRGSARRNSALARKLAGGSAAQNHGADRHTGTRSLFGPAFGIAVMREPSRT